MRAKYVTSLSQVIFSPRTGIVNIEDVERGAELSFSGPLRGPLTSALRTLHHRQILFSNDQILVGFTKLFWFQTGQTDAISMFWAFLVLKN